MREVMISTDPVAVSFAEAVLAEAGLPFHVADRAMSATQALALAIPMRLLVDADRWGAARRLLAEAGLGPWLVAAEG